MLARWPIWRTSKFLNISSKITQHSYQITGQTRWHLVGTDKTYIQFKKILEKLQLITEILAKFHTSTLEQVLELIMEPIRIVNPSNFVL